MDLRPRAASVVSAALLALLASGVLAEKPEEKRDAAMDGALEAIPDPSGLAPAIVAPVNPLFQPLDRQPRLLEPPAAKDYRRKATLYLTLKLDETGKVLEAEVIDPPLRGLAPGAIAAALRWTFDPAKKDGKPVRTWATCGLDLTIDLDQFVFTSFSLVPVAKEDPIAQVPREPPDESALLGYPKVPPDAGAGLVSVEDVDFLPAARKTPWRFDATRLKSRLAAIVQVSPLGAVERIIPTGTSFESFILAWVRQQASTWKIAPAANGGTPRRAFMNLDLVVEYEIAKAKDSARRVLKKNLKGSPAG